MINICDVYVYTYFFNYKAQKIDEDNNFIVANIINLIQLNNFKLELS